MNNHVPKWLGLLTVALTLAMFSPQLATADDNDPPGRVARLGYTRGSVSFEPGGTDEWVDARINRPMTTGDKLWTDAGGLAEMNTGSEYIRVGSLTGFSFLNLSDYATQVQLTEGTLLVRLRRLDQNETFEIDTPNLAFSIYQPGTYKVTVNERGDVTDVQVRQGEGEVTGGGAAYTLQAGDDGRFAGTDGLVADISGYQPRSDDFDNWSSQRDRRIDHSYSSKYVSPDVIGSEGLDQYGGWRSSGEYGNVWFPHTTEVGWAPYHNGHWAYIAPWGYTWVDDEPWGFAPFHYGRWVNVEGAWGWVPGRRESEYGGGEAYVRPVYAPALVAWVGGPHFAIGISVGGGGGYSQGENVGWFPLGPREVYVPSYPVSRTYVNNVNVSNTNVTNTVVNNYYNTTVVNNTNNNTTNNTNVNVTNVKYVNQSVPGAITATTPQAFVSAQPVAKNTVQVNQREISTAPVRIAAPAVAPSREAVLGTAQRASVKPPEAVVNRTVVAKVAPPPPPVPFVQQQKAIEANGGKPLAGSEIHQMQVKEQQQVQRAPQPQQQRTPSAQPTQAPPQVQQTPQQAIRIAPPAQPQTARPAQAQINAPKQPAATPNNQQQPPQVPAQQGGRPGQPVAVPPNQQQQTNKSDQLQNNNVNRQNALNNQSNRPPNTPDPALEQKHQQEQEQLHKQQDLERQRVEQQQQAKKVQEQNAADQQRQQQQQQVQRNADLQQQQARKVQEQNAADQQRQQQQQQVQRNADLQQQQARKVQEQNATDQQRQQQQQQAQRNVDQQRQQQQSQRAADQVRQQLDQRHQQELMQLEQKHAQEQQVLNQRQAQEHQQQARPQPPPPQRQAPPPPPPQKDKEKPPKDSKPPQ